MTINTRPARPLRFFFMIPLLFLVFIGQTAAADIVEDRTVEVGIYENEPKVFTSKAGKPAGIFIDIIEHIAKSEGWKLQYVPGTWAEGLERLTKGKIDLMPDVPLRRTGKNPSENPKQDQNAGNSKDSIPIAMTISIPMSPMPTN